MNVLVVGYGKIGGIKAAIWQKLGRSVFVYDTDEKRMQQAAADGLTPFTQSDYSHRDWLVDISTPAAFHMQSLQWVLDLEPLPRATLIEKPLASDLAELQAMQRLLSQEELQNFKDSIAVDESYFLSTALQLVAKDIIERSLRILNIDIELSKNRLDDVSRGRFVDENLGSLGIELPHMLAMLQVLNVDIGAIGISDVIVHRKPGNLHNEGFTANLLAADALVRLRSYLGDFRFEGDDISDNLSMTRHLKIHTDKSEYVVLFDPVSGLERYMSQVTITDLETGQVEERIVKDDHLSENLKKMHLGHRDSRLDKLLGVDNSIKNSQFIFRFHELANIQEVGG